MHGHRCFARSSVWRATTGRPTRLACLPPSCGSLNTNARIRGASLGTQPRLPARLQGGPGQLHGLRRVERALPHRRRKRATAFRDQRRARLLARFRRDEDGLADDVDRAEGGRHEHDRLLDAVGHTQRVTAEHVILALPFAVLRTLDYSGAKFDPLKKTAITQLGNGRNSKLQLQFASRLWNTEGAWGLSNGATYADTGYQNTWDVTRGQAALPGSSSTTPVGMSPARSRRARRTQAPRARTSPRSRSGSSGSSNRSSPGSRNSGTARRRCRRRCSTRT
jgi:Flavin containing amine oxidoreductase